MHALDFLHAAAVAAPVLARTDRPLGEAIHAAVAASVNAAGCNTNLGIVLLAAPLMRAAAIRRPGTALRGRLARVLRDLSVADSVAVFAAIRTAAPGGLGRSNEQDVAEVPDRPLQDIMRIAAVRDRIAWQYTNDFDDVFTLVLPSLRHYRERGTTFAWAVTGAYLKMLGAGPDTHIVRKFGAEAARDVCTRARALERDFKACENPATLASRLNEFDRELKRGGVNPGTTADLTVAGILTLLLQHA